MARDGHDKARLEVASVLLRELAATVARLYPRQGAPTPESIAQSLRDVARDVEDAANRMK